MHCKHLLIIGLIALSLQPVKATVPSLILAPFAFPQVTQPNNHLTIVAVGDVLLHKGLHQQMLREPNGAQSLWTEVEPWIAQADIAYANLEGPVAPGVRAGGVAVSDPGNVFDNRVYASYPLFNYHARLAQDLAQSGFDVVSTANNHALDRGALGADRTLDSLDAAHLAHTGTRRQADEGPTDGYAWAIITETRGWRLAWLACSFSTNGIPDRHHQVLNCFQDKATLLAQVSALAKERSIDAVIVTPHVGVEYEDRPRADVVQLDNDLVDAGALAVLGAHPHVTQPWTIRTAPDGHVGLIVYSLGNFVSGQFQRVPTRASILVQLQLARDSQGKVALTRASYLPLEMIHTQGQYRVHPIMAETGTPAIYQRLIRMFGSGPVKDPGSGGEAAGLPDRQVR